jgi:putative ABC transport system substrate-binding protein
MKKLFRIRFFGSQSDNLKSKTCAELGRSIQNLKWLGLLVLLVGWAAMAQAQQPKKVYRIGLLSLAYPPSPSTGLPLVIQSFRQGLRDLGYVEGQNITIEYRYAEGKSEKLPELAAELVRLKLDVIFTVGGSQPALALKNATKAIPIVFGSSSDAVGTGLVASFARPGGNITGLSNLNPELSGKRLELLKETFPRVSRIAVLWNPEAPDLSLAFKETQAAARALGLELQSLEVRGPVDFEGAFKAAAERRAGALSVPSSPYFFPYRAQIANLAVKSRLPAIYADREYVEAGGLMSYGPNLADQYRRAATYVDKILKGRKPADLPVEQPIKFEFIINLKAAKQIGLTIPPNVLVRADKVIR